MERVGPWRKVIPTHRRGTQFARYSYPEAGAHPADFACSLLLPTIVTFLLWVTSVQRITLFQASCAWLLLCFPWGAYLSWKQQRRYEVSIFAFVSGMYWLYYGVAMFYGDRLAPSIYSTRILTEESITQSMMMAVLGVGCLWVGMQTPIGRSWIPNYVPEIKFEPSSINYVRAVLFIGMAFGLLENVAYIFGEAGRQLILGLQTSVPLVAFSILFRLYLKGQAAPIDKVLLAFFFISKFVVGVSGGWLGTILFVAIICFILYLAEKRRPPWIAVIPVLFYVIFFQAGKGDFRAENWYGGARQTMSERLEGWSTLSLNVWREALNDPSGEKRAELLKNVVMRVSLLTQTANVLEYTPSEVPYQQGGTYSYLLATWIPRALWPDKPSASEANRFYQVAYHLTTEENLENVAIAVGSMTEAYINFGWIGVALVMYGLGLLFNWTQNVFLTRNSGLFLGAIGVTMVINFIGIEAQMAIYISGLLQNAILVSLIFLPILRIRHSSRPTRPLS